MKPATSSKRGRPAGKPGAATSARKKRRQKIAAGVIAGKAIAAVARDEGVSRSWASREANCTETKVIIASMLDRHVDKLEVLVGKALVAIHDAFRAKDGKRPDHRVRLIAAKRVIEMALAGRTASTSTEERTITWEQFQVLYRSKTA